MRFLGIVCKTSIYRVIALYYGIVVLVTGGCPHPATGNQLVCVTMSGLRGFVTVARFPLQHILGLKKQTSECYDTLQDDWNSSMMPAVSTLCTALLAGKRDPVQRAGN